MNQLNLEFIKNRRNELQLTLQDMAIELGFKNASTYKKYEDGTYSFKANHLPVLANKLQCQISDMYFFDKSVAKTETKTSA